ncbi:MAG: permease [Candidatus Omnitrophota bacterium]|nr:permease [Candidatus Omnitrophota bacterium]
MKDPICGMQVKENEALRLSHSGKDYYFCSSHCRDKFIKLQGIKEPVCSISTKKPFFKNKLFIVSAVTVLLLIVSLFIAQLEPFRKAFLIYIKSIWWAISLGLLLGGVIDYYVPQEYISKILSRRHPKTILNAVGLGFLMSACSHGILALSIQLHKKGASNPAIISFLLASPWANFTITLMLFSFFGLKGLLIVVSAIIVAINTGLIFMFLERKGLIEKNKNIVEFSENFSIIKDIKARIKSYKFSLATLTSDFKGVIKGSLALTDMVLWWIILGILIASFAGAYIPTHIFHKFMGPTILGLLVTLALATVIEVCSEGSSPLAFEIYRQTGALGNSFTFLMAGVVTDYTEIGLIWANIGRRTALWLPLICVPQIILLGYLFNIFAR